VSHIAECNFTNIVISAIVSNVIVLVVNLLGVIVLNVVAPAKTVTVEKNC
jgi:hypothetical protein